MTRASSIALRHLAVIMDGNGRWAQNRGLPRSAGHQKGADTLGHVIQACINQGIPYLTAFGFSSENWKRPVEEVKFLMELCGSFLTSYEEECHKHHVRLKVIGQRDKLDEALLQKITTIEKNTYHYRTLTFQLALSYGGRDEIVRACRHFSQEVLAGHYFPEDLTEALFSSFLDTKDIPDPDLLLRTAESRISNFLLWQLSYAELLFLEKEWPDITEQDIREAVEYFQNQKRRFGSLEFDRPT